jgi:hypothetical protein
MSAVSLREKNLAEPANESGEKEATPEPQQTENV